MKREPVLLEADGALLLRIAVALESIDARLAAGQQNGSYQDNVPLLQAIADYVGSLAEFTASELLAGASPTQSQDRTLTVQYKARYDTRALAKLDIVDWIEGFYNRRRMHSSIDYVTPVDAESSFMAA